MDVNKISNTTKNVVYLILLVAAAAGAYFQIYANQKAIEDVKREVKHDFELHGKRSDKRYKRALEMGKDHESRIRRTEKDITYIQGKEGY